jgi:dTDP-4-amino-4,6-dideoxygalactose transaminase
MKIFKSIEDLAVLGAPPAFSEPLHVGRPNIGNRETFLKRVGQILDTAWLTNNGPQVQEFETRIAEYLGIKHCVAMCNGTVALEIAIRALGLKGEVIVPSFTFIATAHSLHWQEITPVFADINPFTHNLDPESVRRMITPRTSGIIGVHLWGRPSAIDALQSIADKNGLSLMFDASHAFTCTYRGVKIGNFGLCEVFSFHATKFFNSFEGGAVVTNDDKLAAKMRLMKNFGFSGYDNVIHPGVNGKMTEICAAMGLTNLESLNYFKNINKSNYECYCLRLKSIDGLHVLEFDQSEQNNFQYVVIELGPKFHIPRDKMIKILHAENILARKYFWPGCHNMLPYSAYYPHSGMLLPHTKSVAERIIVLPTGAAMTIEKIETVTDLFRLIGNDAERIMPKLAS